MPSLPYWLFPGDDRPPEEIDDEITEELQLHLDLMAEEQMRQGIAPDTARQQAAKRFGDFDSLVRQCRIEKQGDVPMLKRVQAVLMSLLLLAVIWLGVRDYFTAATTAQYMEQTTSSLKTIHADLKVLRADRIYAINGIDSRGVDFANGVGGVLPLDAENAVVIQVVDESDKPVPDAKLSIAWSDDKLSWTDSFSTSTNDDGIYIGKSKDPNRRLRVVTAYAQGYAFATKSLMSPFGQEGEPFVVTLTKGVEQKIRLLDDSPDSAPLGDVRVSASKRVGTDGIWHVVAVGEIPGLSTKTDSEGYCTVDWFAEGDDATIYFLRNSEAQNASFLVTPEVGDTVMANQTPKLLSTGGGAF